MKKSIMLACVILSGCASKAVDISRYDSVESAKDASVMLEEYLVGVGDTVNINVWKQPDLSLSVPVRPDGKISMPLLGDIAAAGQAPSQIADTIKLGLSRYIREPQVTVIMTSIISDEYISKVRVLGAVTSPISLDYKQGLTALDAVLAAGNLNEFAAGNSAILIRKTASGTKKYRVKLGDILNKGELETNYYLLPGDILTIPEQLL